jgi:hypothetical protein
LNVDGGATNNNPSQLAHDFLAKRNPKATECRNPRPADQANAAVLTVAPFPATMAFDPNYQAGVCAGVFQMLGKMITVLLSQSRFLGESLEVLASPTGFSRFVIAPKDADNPGLPALHCGSLGAFGGFFERGFRAHDYLLGRRNCQQFLSAHFVLPVTNPIIAAGQAAAGLGAAAVLKRFRVAPPTDEFGQDWLPLVPLTGTATTEVAAPKRSQISQKSLDDIVNQIIARLKAIRPQLLEGAPMFLKVATSIAFWPIAVNSLKNALNKTLTDALCPNVEGQSPSDCKQKQKPC